jgi:hypothetical protein
MPLRFIHVEAKIRMITVSGQPGQKSFQDPISMEKARCDVIPVIVGSIK